jgi:hypothetical protein
MVVGAQRCHMHALLLEKGPSEIRCIETRSGQSAVDVCALGQTVA